MENPQKCLTIPMWFKKLWSTFIRKSFNHLCSSKHFIKQNNQISFQVSPQKWNFVGPHWQITSNVFIVWFSTICPNSFIIDTAKFCAAIFCYRLPAGRYLPFLLLNKFHGLHSRKLINNFHMAINKYMLKKCIKKNFWVHLLPEDCFNNVKLFVEMWILFLYLLSYNDCIVYNIICMYIYKCLRQMQWPN